MEGKGSRKAGANLINLSIPRGPLMRVPGRTSCSAKADGTGSGHILYIFSLRRAKSGLISLTLVNDFLVLGTQVTVI